MITMCLVLLLYFAILLLGLMLGLDEGLDSLYYGSKRKVFNTWAKRVVFTYPLGYYLTRFLFKERY
jgi:hypothetical protein